MFCNQFVRPFLASALISLVVMSSGCQLLKREKAETLIQQASASLAADDFRRNADLLKQAAKTDPANLRVWWKLCEAYQLTNELDHAVEACKQELTLHPSPLSHNGFGLVYRARKEYSQAASEFEKAAADSDDSGIHSNYVWALLKSEQYERAIPAAQRLVELSKADPPALKTTQNAYSDLALAYMKAGQKDKAQEAVHKGFGKLCSMIQDNKGDFVMHC